MAPQQTEDGAPAREHADAPLICAEDVHLRYAANEVEAVRGVTLSIQRGEFLAIMGPSGSGKSTLLHLLAALDFPTAGRVVVDGVDTQRLRGSALARFRREHVGLIFQKFHLLPTLTVIENVMAPLLPYRPTRPLRLEAQELLARVGLEQRAQHLPGELSGGQQQRVAVARALIAHPMVLLADEPTGSLDSATGGAVMDLLQALREPDATTLVIVTHDPRVAERAQRRVRMEEGLLAPE